MNYWIQIKGGERGPYTEAEIVSNFGAGLPCDTPCAVVGENEWATLGTLLPSIGSGPPSKAPAKASNPSSPTDFIADSILKKIISVCIIVVAGLAGLPFLLIAEQTGNESFRGVFFVIFFAGVLAAPILSHQILVISAANPGLPMRKVLLVLLNKVFRLVLWIPLFGPLLKRMVYGDGKTNPFTSK